MTGVIAAKQNYGEERGTDIKPMRTKSSAWDNQGNKYPFQGYK
jgi:hypothetical protein